VTPSTTWPAPPATIVLEPHDVHVWRVALDLPAAAVAELARVLASDEHVWAARFRFARDRERFIVARGALRTILGGYLARDAARLRLGVGAQGKPHLRAGSGVSALRFNVAHSEDLALIAVTWRREVGVDVERERADRVDLDVARRMFADEDVHALEALPPTLQQRAFFALWTIREAYAKGTGLGLAAPEGATPSGSWSVRQLPIDGGYAAALAVERGDVSIRCWQWSLPLLARPVDIAHAG
jgi:4'-phosphopantetheinyl transferase